MRLQRWQILCVLMCSFFATHGFAEYEKQSDGVLLKLAKQKETDPQRMKIQVCANDIIRVLATCNGSFSDRSSLMVDRKVWPPVQWTAVENEKGLEIATPALRVRIDQKSGAVSFHDANGKLLLRERAPGGKILQRANVMGENTFHIQQLFDSPQDEAFYGLGAHQNAIMNYKGHDVDLMQYNIVDVTPFLVSNKNYGILWDNYSRTKFGDIREYQPLSGLVLYDRQGVKGGLTVEYFKNNNFASLLTTQMENKIEHDFLDQPGIYPSGFNLNQGSIRWTGKIEATETGVHKFRLYSSSFTKMWLNDVLVVDSWRQNWLAWTHVPELSMQAGKTYSIRIEWIPNGGNIGLKYKSPEDPGCQNTLSLYSNVADQIEYYFIHGANFDEVIKGYREITGKAPMMPKWAMGLWQCRERYQSQDELLSVVKEFRQRQIPLDNIVQDWRYWKDDQWGSHEFDASRFPDPDAMVKELHNQLHTHIMISVWPKFYVGLKHYQEFEEKGWLYMHAIERGLKDWVGPGYVSTFFDPFSEGARDLFWKQVNEKLFSKGFDAWWMDSVEPDLGSGASEAECLLRMHPNAMGTAARYENAYSLMINKGVYENQRKTSPNQRVFILTRSVYAGQQRYAAAVWSGDIATRWYDFKAQIPAGLNMALSGIPYWTTDIGGFAVEPRFERPNAADLEEWRELNARWFQFAAFCPLLRSHGQFPYREMFNVAPENHPAFQTMLAYDKLRYRLMPYIYSLVGMVTQQDYTIMRALPMDFGSDKKVLNIGDQFMFGPALLVNPVTEYRARTRPLYLPEGTDWYDLTTGLCYSGGQTIEASAPYERIPLFVKAGSILPCGPEIQYADEKNADPIRLFVYTGADGAFSLYEDENINYNYEKGQFALISFRYDEKAGTLTIGKRRGEFPGMPRARTFEIVWISKTKPSGLDFQKKADTMVTYNGQQQTVSMK